MISGFEQALLYGVTVVILAGTLVVWVVAYVRRYGRKRDRDDDPST
ncbi:hypothetical protein [Microbacterium immunditiarum]|uniref:Uncharacterized protein n=1 Tax=Microbacterium immunditiarum TaxID=337480 RepID=A0A7Y9GL49_9MICO|nr:hypothetical protein [Microbacterium immunditiarum]NYE18326.1 hypothetical protein [Microbacterium immunditiarum]